MSRFGERRPLEAACWAVAAAYVAGAVVCLVGNFTKDAPWVYIASLVVAGAVWVGFVLTALVLAVTARGASHRPGRLRAAVRLWWENASTTEKAAVLGAGVLAACLTVAGIVGTAQHSELMAPPGTFVVVIKEVFDDFRYAHIVLGLLGPAMALSSLLFLIYRAFLLVVRRRDLARLEG